MQATALAEALLARRRGQVPKLGRHRPLQAGFQGVRRGAGCVHFISFTAQPPDLRQPSFDHKSFADSCPIALATNAFYPVLVHRLAASLHASSPHSVTLMQLRFASFAVINLRWDLHPQECAHAGRTRERPLSLAQ